jgi:hypothetical protein
LGVGAVEGGLTAGAHLGGGVEVDRCRGVHADPGMAVLVVVVSEELVAEFPRIGQAGLPQMMGTRFREFGV